jgi:3-keto-disaccharide hydrolase
MRTLFVPALAALLGFVALSGQAAEEGFTPLFDGKSLAGWKPYLRPDKSGVAPDPMTVWSIVDGTIVCKGKPNGYIATEKEYGDYVLKVKWRFPADSKGGNSGVLLHVTGADTVWPNSVEAQLAAGQAGDFWLIADDKKQLPKLELDESRKDPKNKEGRHYFRIDKDTPVEKKFGEWNQYEITCKGGDITLVVNGKKVNEGKNGALTKGRIALQSEGAEIHFKDIEIKSLK